MRLPPIGYIFDRFNRLPAAFLEGQQSGLGAFHTALDISPHLFLQAFQVSVFALKESCNPVEWMCAADSKVMGEVVPVESALPGARLHKLADGSFWLAFLSRMVQVSSHVQIHHMIL